MPALRLKSKLKNEAADILVLDASPVVFSPVSGRWSGCQTQAEADERGAVLAVAIADAMIGILQHPLNFQVTLNTAVAQPSSTGGYVVSIILDVAGHSKFPAQILVPSATSESDAKEKAYNSLLSTVSDTVAHCWPAFKSQILAQKFDDNPWPSWAVKLRRSWIPQP